MITIIDMSIIAVPVLFVYLLLRLLLIKKIKFEFKKDMLRIAFVIYLSCLIFIVWINNSFYSNYLNYNFIPFKTIVGYLGSSSVSIALRNTIGNVILTIPLGFFAYYNIRLLPRLNILSYSFLVPILIEFGQFILFLLKLQTRSIDIDDILLNALGILFGYYCTKSIFNKRSYN